MKPSYTEQISLFGSTKDSDKAIRNGVSINIDPIDTTFQDNSRASFHSWFPYLEGYSPRFVQSVVNEYLPNAQRILEPFAGSGTTPIVLGQIGIECAYSEVNPAMVFIIKTKLQILAMDHISRQKLAIKIRSLSRKLSSIIANAKPDPLLAETYNVTFGNSIFFDDSILNDILRLRTISDEICKEDKQLGDCLNIAVLANLIPSSKLKRAGDLRFRTAKELLYHRPHIIQSVSEHLIRQAIDISTADELTAKSRFACDVAGNLHNSVEGTWDGVITSPPYLNGTNYIRNARLELWYQRELQSKADLRRLRDKVITSGINDVDSQTDWRPVTNGVKHIVGELENKAYDQRIAKMVGGYFRDMHNAMASMSACLLNGGRICIDIGDSIYAGVHVPTDNLLVEVAESIGFRTVERIHLRKRISNGGQPIRQQLLIFEKEE